MTPTDQAEMMRALLDEMNKLGAKFDEAALHARDWGGMCAANAAGVEIGRAAEEFEVAVKSMKDDIAKREDREYEKSIQEDWEDGRL